MKRKILLSVLLFAAMVFVSLSFCACAEDDTAPQGGENTSPAAQSEVVSFSSAETFSSIGGQSSYSSASGQETSQSDSQSAYSSASGQEVSQSDSQSNSASEEENNSSSAVIHNDPAPVGISVYAVKTQFFAGETVSAGDLTVQLDYDDQSHENLTVYTIEYQTGDCFNLGDDHYTVVYGSYSGEVTVTVVADNLKITSDVYNSVVNGYLSAEDTATQISYLLNYSGQENDKQKIKVGWRKISGASYYVFRLSTDEEFSCPITKTSTTYEAVFGTLIPNTEYYAYAEAVSGNGDVIMRSETCVLKAETDHTVRQITADGMTNVRDLGGWSAMGGNVIGYGLLYRGSNLVNITESGINVFKNELGIRTEIDLRSNGTRDAVIEGVNYYRQGLALYGAMIPDVDPDKQVSFNVSEPAAIYEIFSLLADENNYPVYFHCNAGADRTGSLAFLIEGLLGVEYPDLIKDYELTSFSTMGQRWRSNIVDGQFTSDGIMQNDSNNYVGFGELYTLMMKIYGGEGKPLSYAIENYLKSVCGVSTETINSVRRILLYAPDAMNGNYELSFVGSDQTAEVIYGKKIGDVLPALPSDTETTNYYWAIDGIRVTPYTVWNFNEDKRAILCADTSKNKFTADFVLTSSEDYKIAVTDIDGGLNAEDVTAVMIGDTSLAFDVQTDSLVFTNALIKERAAGDYTFDVYTATEVYRVKIAVVTMVIRNVADLNVIGANKNKVAYDTGYYVLGNDIDGKEQGGVNELSEWCGDNYMTTGFKGIFDGRGHVLKNLRLTNGHLFFGVGDKAIIRNFALIDPIQVPESPTAYVLASGVHHATIENVIVKAAANVVIGSTWKSTVVRNCVFIIEQNGQHTIGTAGNWNNRQTTISNLAIVVGDPTVGTLSNGAVSFAGLIGTHYVSGSYSSFKTENCIYEYSTLAQMLVALSNDNYITAWGSRFIAYDNYGIWLNGVRVVQPVIGLTAPSNEIIAGESMTISAVNASFELTDEIEGVSVDAKGLLTVGNGVATGTEITVRATSLIDGSLFEEITIKVVPKPVDLTANGTYDVELGAAFTIAAIDGDVIAVKTASGGKVTLGTPNVVTANEFNKAADAEWSEGLNVTFYTENKAYSLNAAFITKIIRSVADLKEISAYGKSHRTSHTGYYVVGNDIDGENQESFNALSYDSATHDNYTTNGFRGILDGRGHVLKNLKLAEGRFFWGIGNNAVVKNLALIDPVQESGSGYIFARDLVHATLSNVVVKANTGSAFLDVDCGTVITNCVFILETNGSNAIGTKDDTFGTAIHTPSVLNNVAVVVKSNSGTMNALFGTYYKINETYAAYEAANGIHDYATSAAMLAGLSSSNYIAGWNSPYITYEDGSLKFNGVTIV